MYYNPYMYQCPHCANAQMYNYGGPSGYWTYPMHTGTMNRQDSMELRDYGSNPFTININEATKQNNTFRTALWTGTNLQVTLMSLGGGEDIGLEMHPDVDQFLRIEQGQGVVRMGKNKEHLDFIRPVSDDSAIIIPAGTWHNVTNTGHMPLRLYSIYSPPNHPFGTVHQTKADAEKEHH